MSNPKINIPPDQQDKVLEGLSLIGLILMPVTLLFFYGDLPPEIPLNFNVQGQPDSYATKETIWILPALALMLFVMLTAIQGSPHQFNYSVPITPENAADQYRNALRMLRWLKTVIIGLFVYLQWGIIQVGMGHWMGLGPIFLPLLLIILFGVIGFFVHRSYKLK